MSVSGRSLCLGRDGRVGVGEGWQRAMRDGIGQQCWEREFRTEFRCPGQSSHGYTHHVESSGEDGPNVERTYLHARRNRKAIARSCVGPLDLRDHLQQTARTKFSRKGPLSVANSPCHGGFFCPFFVSGQTQTHTRKMAGREGKNRSYSSGIGKSAQSVRQTQTPCEYIWPFYSVVAPLGMSPSGMAPIKRS